ETNLLGVADDCTVSVSQLPELEVDYRQKVVTLTCSFSTVGCPAEKPTRLWFRYGTHKPENLCSNGCSSETDKYTLKYPAQNQVSLTVNRLTFNDSAIYICGIAFRSSKQPRAKQTGGGTVLVVRANMQFGLKNYSNPISQPLQTESGLLRVLYSLCPDFTGKERSLRVKKVNEKDQRNFPGDTKRSARRIFQEIAQELYNKRHAERSQPTEKDNTYENRTALSNYERP
ncbi:hypothetical protein FD754_012018, partial [Muntiacus muntjak]